MNDAVQYLKDVVHPDIDLADLLDAVSDFLVRFVAFQSKTQVVACSLWIAHTHAIEAADNTGYLAVTSAEKRSGKTRLLDVLELVVAKPWRTVLPSEAVLYRKLADSPGTTLLLDEIDAVFGPQTAKQHEGVRALLNAGYRRGATVPRCVGEGRNLKVVDFEVFGAKAIAGIGSLPTTVADRSIHVRLQRRAKSEPVERFRYWEVASEGGKLREQLASALPARLDVLRSAHPKLPYALDDRLADSWEPLLGIADLASGAWPEAARIAALELAGVGPEDDDSLGVQLLRHMREALGTDDHITTEKLLKELVQRDDAMWPVWWGSHVGDGKLNGPAARLARILKPFGIKPKKIRLSESATGRGFQARDLRATFERYLSPDTPVPTAVKEKSDSGNLVGPVRVSAISGNVDENPNSASDQGSSEYPTYLSVQRERNGPVGGVTVSPPTSRALHPAWPESHDDAETLLLDTFPGSQVVTDPVELAAHHETVELGSQSAWVRSWNDHVKKEEERSDD